MSEPPVESSSHYPSDVEVPAEIRRTGSEPKYATGCLLAAIFVLGPALIYFGFFGLILIDELVLNTRYLSQQNLPQQVVDGLVIIYAPLIYLTRWALGIE